MASDVDHAVTDAMRAVADAMVEFGRAAGVALEVALANMAALCQELDAAMRAAYESAGMPYGDSDVGMERWLRERARIERLRAEADEMEGWHETFAELRRRRSR